MKNRWELHKKHLIEWLLGHDQELMQSSSRTTILRAYTHDELRLRAIRNPAFDLSRFAHDPRMQELYNTNKNASK